MGSSGEMFDIEDGDWERVRKDSAAALQASCASDAAAEL